MLLSTKSCKLVFFPGFWTKSIGTECWFQFINIFAFYFRCRLLFIAKFLLFWSPKKGPTNRTNDSLLPELPQHVMRHMWLCCIHGSTEGRSCWKACFVGIIVAFCDTYVLENNDFTALDSLKRRHSMSRDDVSKTLMSSSPEDETAQWRRYCAPRLYAKTSETMALEGIFLDSAHRLTDLSVCLVPPPSICLIRTCLLD